jgi:hypothetical protein
MPPAVCAPPPRPPSSASVPAGAAPPRWGAAWSTPSSRPTWRGPTSPTGSAGPRIRGRTAHQRTPRWLREALGVRADTAALQPVTFDTAPGKPPVKMASVLARFRPAAPRRILRVARWDSHPRAGRSADPPRTAAAFRCPAPTTAPAAPPS